VARIDVPLLEGTNIEFFHRLVFDIVQFPDFVYRTETFTLINQADVVLKGYSIVVKFSPKGGAVDSMILKLEIKCTNVDWQLSAFAEVCDLCLPTVPDNQIQQNWLSLKYEFL